MTDYSSEIDELLGNQKSQILNNAGNSVGVNPDTEADLQNASKLLNIPLSSARQYKADVDRQMARLRVDPDQIVTKSPALASFLQDQNNFNKSHDDIPNLQAIHAAVNPVTETMQQWNPSIGERYTSWMHDLFGINQKDIARASIARSEKTLGITDDEARASIGGMSAQTDAISQFGGGLVNSASLGVIPNTSGDAKTFLGSASGALGTLGGFITGAPLKLAEYGMGKAGITALDHVAGESFLKATTKDMAKGAATLATASSLGEIGNAINSPDVMAALKKKRCRAFWCGYWCNIWWHSKSIS